MSDQPAPPSLDLVHLITYLACSPTLRDPVLNIIFSYLDAMATKDGKELVDVVFEQEQTVLGPVYRQFIQRLLDFGADETLTGDEVDAKAIAWLFAELTTIGGLEVTAP